MDPVIFKIICDKCLNLKFLVLPPPPKEKKNYSPIFVGVLYFFFLLQAKIMSKIKN